MEIDSTMKFHSLFLIALAFFQAGLTNAYGQENKTPYQTKEFKVSGQTTVKSELSGASVSIKGGAGDALKVQIFLKKDGVYLTETSKEAQDFLEDFKVEVTQTGETVMLIAKQKSPGSMNWKNRPQVSFEISSPMNLNTDIQTSGGSVSLERIAGTQTIQTSGGSIRIQDSEGLVNTQSSGGSFNLNGFQGNVDVRTSGGSVKIYGLQGDLEAHTSGGGMTLENIKGSVDAQSSGGSIRAILSEVNEEMNFSTSGGSISAVIPKGLGLDLEISGSRVNSALSNFSGEIKKDRISGKLNGGGIPLKMQSSGGSINLEFN
jgi:hypothetical protein